MKLANAIGTSRQRFILAVTALSVICLSRANASTYTYDVNAVGGALSGVITTDCDVCVLNSSNITAWSLNSGTGALSVNGTPVIATSLQSGAQITGSGMVATPSAISFGFGTGSGDEINFISHSSEIEFADLASSLGSESFLGLPIGEVDACTRAFQPGGEIDICGGETQAGIKTIATAKVVSSPEIDPASLASSLTLLFGMLAVITTRGTRPDGEPLIFSR
jgi:hypothetical protein